VVQVHEVMSDESSFFFITLGLEMSDTKVYEPQIRDLLGTPSQYREAVE